MKKKMRKPMSNIVQFLDSLDIDCAKNLESLIAMARVSNPFRDVEWHSAKWDITHAVGHKSRGHETRITKNLNFFRNVPNNSVPIDGEVGDVIKAMSILRYKRGGQGAANQQRFIDGWRYIFDAMGDEKKISIINPEVLETACRVADMRLKKGTAYNVHKSIHEISDLLDSNKLVKVHLGFRYSAMKRPVATSGVGYVRLDDPVVLETSSPKMADDLILEAMGMLYKKIPQTALADRMRILLVTLAIFLGRRIGEILTMPARGVQCNENGTHYVVVYPQKKSQGDLVLVESHVPVPTACLKLVTAVIDELLELTQPIRNIAEYIHQHGHADYRPLEPYESQGWMTSKDLEQCFGISSGNGQNWAKTRKLTSQPRQNRIQPNQICWSLDQVKAGMNADIDMRPMLVSRAGSLFHKDCLAIIPLNACQSKKCTFNYAVRLIEWQQSSDFLGSGLVRRNGSEKYEKRGKVLSVFDRYFEEGDANRLSVNSHAFRHTLATWLDEGGMSDAAQTRWFDRSNPRDTKAYQHTSPSKAALMARRDLLDGKISGPVSESIKFVPINIREAFVKARIRAVIDVGPGVCFHDFSQMPCSRSLQCTASCDDYHWRSDDVGRVDELRRQYAITILSQEESEKRAAIGRGKSMDWVAHNNKKIAILKQQMQEQGVAEFNPGEYLSTLEKA